MGSLLDGILNGGFFTGTAKAGFVGNLEAGDQLEALPALDSSHQPFKRTDQFVGGPRKQPRTQQGKWACEWQEPGTGKPDGRGKLSRAKAKEYSSEQLCTPVGDEAAKHKEGYVKLVRVKRNAKKKYNTAYKKFVAKEEKKGKQSRGYPQATQSKYVKRPSKWPKFENPNTNKAFAKRMAKMQKQPAPAPTPAVLPVLPSQPAVQEEIPLVIDTTAASAAPAAAPAPAPAPRKRGGGKKAANK